MRHALLPVLAAVCLFITGAFILNLQLWYSARAESYAGARYAAKNINAILDEAMLATRTAIEVSAKSCNVEGQYQLGTEAALQPHLRTLLIVKQAKVWCSSLPGNGALLTSIPAMTNTPLFLVPSRETLNKKPVLIYQTHHADSQILVTISDQHVRGALDMSSRERTYSLRVGNNEIGMSGDVRPADESLTQTGRVASKKYPFSIMYPQPPLFDIQRIFRHGLAILIFLLLITAVTAYVLDKLMNKSATPQEILRGAIARGEIVPFYQPVVDGRDGSLRGVEVLARWKHPTAGYISPASFIPIAEKSGLIIPLTQSLMKQVADNMNAIMTKLPEGFHVGINFSASHITSPTFVEECLKFRDSFHSGTLHLVVEVTEREPLHVDEALVQRLNILHENGFVIALDDFGTGYSGLSYLHDLHIDYIKIDQSFVARVNADPDSTRILDCVLDLARKLSLSIVAEGVETKEQLDYLNQNNITFLQGYYFYRPVPFTELVKILLSKPRVKVVVE
ncbi:EAL domain-containing protein [Enterobacteriaceae bacterium RIT691]|nr:EAL domain-containing protein [Enterobacteriaceae bacterium RIT691]